MDLRLQHSVREFKGDSKLSSVVVEDLKTGGVEEMTPGAVFIFIGLDSNTEFLKGVVDLDDRGFYSDKRNLGDQYARRVCRRRCSRRQYKASRERGRGGRNRRAHGPPVYGTD